MADVPANRHPADELADARQAKSDAERRIRAARAKLLANPEDVVGDEHQAHIIARQRKRLDRQKLEEAHGALDAFETIVDYDLVITSRRSNRDAF